jgi:hypothetical protein
MVLGGEGLERLATQGVYEIKKAIKQRQTTLFRCQNSSIILIKGSLTESHGYSLTATKANHGNII